MKLTFSKKTNISRKGLLWLYFIIVVLLFLGLVALSYLFVTRETQEQKMAEEKIKINEEELKKLENFRYLGTPIDLSFGLGKQEPFK